VRPVLLWGANSRPLRELGNTKTASEAGDYVKCVEPKPGHTIVLVLALGSYEFYDLNRNGDGFNESPYKVGFKPTCGCCTADDGWISQADVVQNHYKTFETMGKVYRHHQNKDPAKACGDVLKSFWNPTMHRVELLIGVRNDLAPDLVERIADGDYPAVSMGCSPRGAHVLMADGRYRDVAEVREGDTVITHRGLRKRVTGTMTRHHDGEIFTIRVKGYRKPLTLTGEHPLWAIRAGSMSCGGNPCNQGRRQTQCTPVSKATYSGCEDCAHTSNTRFEWIRTDEIHAGDWLATPIPQFEPSRNFSRDEARFLGYYLAEGFSWTNNNNAPTRCVCFCTGLHETATHAEIKTLAARLGARSVWEDDRPERNGKYIYVNAPHLVDLCEEHCGKHARTKLLSASVLGAQPEILAELLGAYANGDGFAFKGALYFSTASEALADQLQVALLRLKMFGAVHTLHHKPSGLVTKPTTEYQVRVGNDYAWRLTTSRHILARSRAPIRSDRFFWEVGGTTYAVSKIASVQTKPYADFVFNFEVADDNSYVLHNLAVHNCRIKYDVCTECGHRAPTRAQYCDHLKYNLRQVGKKGLRYGALNPSPRWFDISWVVKPADQTGFMLKKVAHEGAYEVRASADLGAYLDTVEEKRAAIQKVSDIDKVVRGIPLDHKVSPISEAEERNIQRYHQAIRPALQRMPQMDSTTLNALAEHPVAEVLSTLSAAGVILTTPEFVKLLLAKLAPGASVDEGVLDALVAMQGQVFDLFAKHPQLLDQVMQTHLFDINAKNVKPEIAGKAEKYLEKRSTFGDYLQRALLPPVLRPEEAPFTDTFHVRDPSTGQSYTTTRGAAIAAHDEIARRQLAKTLGGAALLAGGYKILAPGIPGALRPVAAGTAALLGSQTLNPDWGPQYGTEEGVNIPATTELSMTRTANELTRAALPVLGTAGLIAGLGHDYESRLRNGEFVGDPNASTTQRLADTLEQYAHDHPAFATLGGLSLYGLGANALKLSEYLGDVLEPVTDSVELPNVDFDAAATKLGTLLLT